MKGLEVGGTDTDVVEVDIETVGLEFGIVDDKPSVLVPKFDVDI